MRARHILFALPLLSLAAPAMAQIEIRITEADCASLMLHVPDADVAYRPGVDVNGNAVAPADLSPTPSIPLPDTVTIPITLDLASRLGIPPGGNADYLARPEIGKVTVTADGRVAFNGVPLTSDAQHALARRCQEAGFSR